MKDQEIAIIVVGLAGLAFLMAKSGGDDRPSENSRDFYEKPAAPFAERGEETFKATACRTHSTGYAG